MYPLATLCDPYLNLFRGIIPPIGGTIDLSPILAFTVLNVFTNTAAALASLCAVRSFAGNRQMIEITGVCETCQTAQH